MGLVPGQFDECFGRAEPARHMQTYVRGQLSDLRRKSIEPMADAAGVQPRDLQNFLAMHQWDEARMRDTVAEIVARDHGHRCSIGLIDETGHPKKGVKSPGGQRQGGGNTGKRDNCVVTVHLGYAAGTFHCLLDGELFLPEGWSDDRARCGAARIPDTMVHRPKWRIALELRDRAVANAVRFAWRVRPWSAPGGWARLERPACWNTRRASSAFGNDAMPRRGPRMCAGDCEHYTR